MRNYIKRVKLSLEEDNIAPGQMSNEFCNRISQDIAARLPLPSEPVERPFDFFMRECSSEIENILSQVNQTSLINIELCKQTIQNEWFQRYKLVFDSADSNSVTIMQQIAKEADSVFPTPTIRVDESVVTSDESIKIKHLSLISTLEDCEDEITGEDICVSLAIAVAYKLPLVNSQDMENRNMYYYDKLRQSVGVEISKINERFSFNLNRCHELIEHLWLVRCELAYPVSAPDDADNQMVLPINNISAESKKKA